MKTNKLSALILAFAMVAQTAVMASPAIDLPEKAAESGAVASAAFSEAAELYGTLLFKEDFEGREVGASLTGGIRAANGPDYEIRVGSGSPQMLVSDLNGNKTMELIGDGKYTAAQICAAGDNYFNFTKTTKYALVFDYYFTDDQKNNTEQIFTRIYYLDKDGGSQFIDTHFVRWEVDANKWNTGVAEIEICEGEVLRNIEMYIVADGSKTPTGAYIDNVAMYEEYAVKVWLNESKTAYKMLYGKLGDTVSLPVEADFEAVSGKTLKGLSCADDSFAVGGTYTFTEANAAGVPELTPVYEETDYDIYGSRLFKETFESREADETVSPAIIAENAPGYEIRVGAGSPQLLFRDMGDGKAIEMIGGGKYCAAQISAPGDANFNYTKEAKYALTFDYLFTDEQKNNTEQIFTRIYYKDTNGNTGYIDTHFVRWEVNSNEWNTGVAEIEICKGEALLYAELYIVADGSKTPTGAYIDNLALYEEYAVKVWLDEGKTSYKMLYGKIGDTVTLPALETYAPIAGKTVTHLTDGDNICLPNGTYTFSEADTVAVKEFVPVYGKTVTSEYVKPLCAEDFMSYEIGTDISNGISPVFNAENFEIRKATGSPAMVIAQIGGKKALELTGDSKYTAMQICATGCDDLYRKIPGKYCLFFDYYWTDEQKSNTEQVFVRLYYIDKDGTRQTPDTHFVRWEVNANQWNTGVVPFEIAEGEELLCMELYIAGDGDKTPTGVYIGSMALCEQKNVTVWLDEAHTASEQMWVTKVGEEITMPEASSVTVPDGKLLLGFGWNGNTYSAGKSYEIILPDEDVVFEPIFLDLYHETYGKLIAFDDFEAYERGSSLPEGASIAYRDASYPNITYSLGAYCNIVTGSNGSNAVTVQKNSVDDRWPLLALNPSAEYTKAGEYTLLFDAYLPAENGVQNVRSRMTMANAEGGYDDCDESSVPSVGVPYTHKQIMAVDKNVYKAIHSFLVFASNDTTTPDSVYYFDNLALYAKTGIASVSINGTHSYDFYYAPGQSVTLPEGIFADGEVYVNGTPYAYGESYQTAATETTLSINIVPKKRFVFSLGSHNGFVPDMIAGADGTVTLPDPGMDGFIGWEVPYYGECAAGDPVSFDTAVGDNYFGYCLVRALFDEEKEYAIPAYRFELTDDQFAGASDEEKAYLADAYGTGVYPADTSFDGTKSVTVREVLTVACRLYDAFYGIIGDRSDERLVSDATAFGFYDGTKDLDDTADVAFAASVYAGVMPDDMYSVITTASSENVYAQKLMKAGILDVNTDLDADLTASLHAAIAAKAVNRAARSVENNRQLIILGDSLCAGTDTAVGWTSKLGKYLDNTIDVVDLSVTGANTASYIQDNRVMSSVLDQINPGDYVLIALGTNDATLWMWNEHSELRPGSEFMRFEESRDNYHIMASDIRARGGIPVFVAPAGRNADYDKTGDSYMDPLHTGYDIKIVSCMEEANSTYGDNTPIINFRDWTNYTLDMDAEERAKVYCDSVHYTDYGADLICGYFAEFYGEGELAELAAHFLAYHEAGEELYGAPVVINKAQIRSDDIKGLRVAAFVSGKARETADEYGFLVTLEDNLDGDVNVLSFDGATVNGSVGTLSNGKKAVMGAAYSKAEHTDLVYSTDGEPFGESFGKGDDGSVYYTGVLTGIKDVHANIAARPYLKIGETYLYGQTIVRNAYEIAEGLYAQGISDDYVTEILSE